MSHEIISLVVGYFIQLFALEEFLYKTFVFPSDFIKDMIKDLDDPTKNDDNTLDKTSEMLGEDNLFVYDNLIIFNNWTDRDNLKWNVIAIFHQNAGSN